MSTIYKRKDGRWEGRVHKGRGKYISFYALSREEVEKKISELIKCSEKNKFKHNFVNLYTEWFENIAVNIKESTACNYKMKAKTHLIPYFNKINCSEITENHIREFVRQKREEKLSDRYISDMIILLKSVFKYGSVHYSYKNPFKIIKFSFKKPDEVTILDSEQCKILKNSIADDKNNTSAAITLAMATGLRIGELCALQWKDIDLKKRIINVSKTIQRIKNDKDGKKTKIVITDPKTESSKRVIPIPECVVSVIEKLKAESNCYFISGKEKPTEPRTLQYRFSRILKNAKLPSVHFHSLRHVFATKCIQSGMDIKTLSELLGHSRIETTLNLYVHSSFTHKAEAINRVNFDF